MNIFDQSKLHFEVSGHAKTQIVIRTTKNLRIQFDDAEEKILELINEGKLLLETDKFRYVKNGNLFFPCKKDYPSSNHYIVKTVLIYDSMVKHRFQKIIDKYHKNH